MGGGKNSRRSKLSVAGPVMRERDFLAKEEAWGENAELEEGRELVWSLGDFRGGRGSIGAELAEYDLEIGLELSTEARIENK